MKTIGSAQGAVLVCDNAGVVSEILHNQLGLIETDVIGHSMPQVFEGTSMPKALSFLVELRRGGTAFGWEMDLTLGDEVVLIHLMGVVLDHKLLIALAKSNKAVHYLFDEMLRMNSEHVSRLRDATKRRIELERSAPELESKRFDDLTRLNNEMAGLQRELARKNVELERLNQEIRTMAVTDPLTGLLNRRGFFERSERELDASRRFKHDLGGIMFDLDHFKRFNDVHGHAVGDEVLKEVAKRGSDSLRKIDIFGRYGGEEFAIVLPETDLPGARRTAERLRFAVNSEPFNSSIGPLTVSISLGAAVIKPDTLSIEQLLGIADKALYRAKELGRNRVCTDEDLGPPAQES